MPERPRLVPEQGLDPIYKELDKVEEIFVPASDEVQPPPYFSALASEQLRRRLLETCTRLVREPGDPEALAQELWFYAITTGHKPTYVEIKHAAIDLLRHVRVQQEAEQAKAEQNSRRDLMAESHTKILTEIFGEQLQIIFARTSLHWRERLLLYKLFWHGEPLNAAAIQLSLSIPEARKMRDTIIDKLRTTAATLNLKQD